MATLSLYGAILEQHPEWPREERLWLEEQLKSLGITSKQYQKDPWKMDNKVWDAVGTWEEYQAGNHVAVADPFRAPASGNYVNPLSGAGLQNTINQAAAAAAGTVGLNIPPSAEPQDGGSVPPVTQIQDTLQNLGGNAGTNAADTYTGTRYGWVDASGKWVQGLTFKDAQGNTWMMPDPSTGLGGDPIQISAGPQETWSVVTDATGVYQVNSVTGQRVRIGDVPQGVVQGMPTGSAGWGQTWGQSQQYNPTTQRMDTVWNRTPMSAADALAQMQNANLPQNWYNTALQERTMSQDQRQFNNTVSELVADMVGAKQGYGSEFDLQTGQTAMDITPQGWAGVNNWQAGYDPSQYNAAYGTNNAFGSGRTGGYETYVPSAQAYGGWSPSDRQEMYGWIGSGLSGWKTADDYWNEIQRLAPPSGGGSRLSYR